MFECSHLVLWNRNLLLKECPINKDLVQTPDGDWPSFFSKPNPCKDEYNRRWQKLTNRYGLNQYL